MSCGWANSALAFGVLLFVVDVCRVSWRFCCPDRMWCVIVCEDVQMRKVIVDISDWASAVVISLAVDFAQWRYRSQ